MPIRISTDATKIEYAPLKSGTGRWLRGAIAAIPTIPPYRYKGIKKWWRGILPEHLGKIIRIEPKSIETNIDLHRSRLVDYGRLLLIIYFGLTIIIAIPITILVISLIERTQFPISGLFIQGTSILFQFTIGMFITVLAGKIVTIVLDRRFADSLIILSSIYLVDDLNQDNDLGDPEYKRRILERLRILRRNTLLLSQTFTATNSESNQEAVIHLKSIETYIREREGWVITPKKNTLELLRKDFDKLAMVLISGQYGEFKTKTKHKINEVTPVALTFIDKLLRVVFFLFPYLILLILYIRTEFITNLGLNTTTVFLVGIAWILLTIDARLKLGFVERVAGMAKTIKELG